MARVRRVAEIPGFRICNRCNMELPATKDVFIADATRSLGLAYECRACHGSRKKGRDRRTERWSKLSAERKQLVRERQSRYWRTAKGRARSLLKAYNRIDACDMSADELGALIEQPCVYCGTVDYPRGLDRIDNNLPHIKGNVRPACAGCNFARGDRFSANEMDLIGKAIREIYAARAAHAG